MNNTDEIVTLLQHLVEVKSTADRPEELARIIELCERYFDIPELTTTRFASNGKVNLLVQPAKSTSREFEVILNAHLDVVPASDTLFSFRLDNGKAYGRGVYDMKGGAAVLMKLYKDLASKGTLGSVALTLVTDEEIGGHNGAKLLLEQEHVTGKLFLAAEPTDFAICHQQKGIVWVELTEKGKAAHGSRPWEGQNANISLAQKIAAFYAKYPQPTGKDDWKTSYTLSILRGGGEAKNVVADKAVAFIDIRRIQSESAQDILDKLKSVFVGTDITVIMDEPCLDTDPNSGLVQSLVKSTEKVLHTTPKLTRETFGSDGRFYSAVGTPALNFGPVGGDMHGDNEWLNVQSLGTLYQILEDFLTQTKSSVA